MARLIDEKDVYGLFQNNGIAHLHVADIDLIPRIDAVEVVHAHWEDGYAIHNGKEVYKSIDCSHCNDIFKIESETREYWKERFKVCPFCGAVMDGGNEDGKIDETVR